MVAQEVLDGNLHKRVLPKTYEEHVQALYDELEDVDINVKFDPDIHLASKPEDLKSLKVYTLQELGIHDEPRAVNDFALADPFPIFTEEAVKIMRKEIFQKDVFLKFARQANLSTSGLDVQLGGFSDRSCRFLFEANSHPRTLELYEAVIGFPVTNMFDYEVAHINLGLKSKQQAEIEKDQAEEIKEKTRKFLSGDDSSVDAVVSWHMDSNPYTAVIMLSPTDEMVGGETALTKGNGEIITAKQIPRGWCGLIQAGAIRHLALLPFCVTERCAVANAIVPLDPLMKDVNVITSIKPSVLHRSRYNEFYPEWVAYRMKTLMARLDHLRSTTLEKMEKGELFNLMETVQQLKDLITYINGTFREFEVVDEGLETVAEPGVRYV